VSLMTYLWIALGGALGSVGRAWLAFLVARLTGPQFPWGTIGINIVGSFVIAFFGTLTVASAGRFGVPPDVRAFVMVGICGGFTTFSSFSLQTLELARDGRPGHALANIALSVVLCLASVAAGHYGAVALNESLATEQDAQALPETGGRRVLAVLDRPEAARGVLWAAASLLEPGNGGQVDALALIRQPVAALLPTEEVMTAERETEEAEGQGCVAALRANFDRWAARGTAVGWTEVEGPPGEIVAEHGRRADIAVVRRPGPRGDEPGQEALQATLFKAGCPVLVLPPAARTGPGFGRVVAVAWQADKHAAKAVRSAIPLLRRAERVVVLCGTESPGPGAAPPLPRVLADHGINADVVAVVVPSDGEPMGAALLAAAHRLHADLLVMGAFAHGAFRERMLGGVTQHVLAEADLPVLMRH